MPVIVVFVIMSMFMMVFIVTMPVIVIFVRMIVMVVFVMTAFNQMFHVAVDHFTSCRPGQCKEIQWLGKLQESGLNSGAVFLGFRNMLESNDVKAWNLKFHCNAIAFNGDVQFSVPVLVGIE